MHEPGVKPAPARIRERPKRAAMPTRRKIFRIEQMTLGGEPRDVARDIEAYGAASGGAAQLGGLALQQQEVLDELKALRALVEQRPPAAAPGGSAAESGATQRSNNGRRPEQAQERDRQHPSRHHPHHAGAGEPAFRRLRDAGQGRASRELDAVVDSTERADPAESSRLRKASTKPPTRSPPRSSTSRSRRSPATSATRWCAYSRPAISRISAASASPRCWRP